MHFRLALLLPVLSLVLHTPALTAADKVTFRQRWEAGKTYRQEIVMNSLANLPLPEAKAAQDTNIVQQITTVVSKEAGTDRKLAVVKFVAIKAMLTAGDQITTYDSTDPAMSQPFLQQAFGAMLGKTFTLVYDKDDKFVEVRVPEGDVGTPLGDFKGPNAKQFAEALRKSMEAVLPDRPLVFGDTYNYESVVEMPPMAGIKMKSKGRFDSIVQHEGRKHAKLVLENGTVELPAGSAPQMASGTGKLSGEILFDLERKVVSQIVTRQEMKIRIQGQETTLSTATSTTLKGVEDTK